jgi:hypothetical protein
MVKRLPVTKHECESISNWYLFVDKNRRTKIDDRVNIKINILAKKQKGYVSLSDAQVVHRWYYSIPNNIIDNLDSKIFKTIERFIKLNG